MVSQNETDTNRPYGPPANVTTVLSRLRSRNLPERIDAEYLRDAGVSEGTLSRTLFGLRFLRLIDEAGQATQALRSIHTATDEEYRDILGTLVRTAYADVFEQMNPAEDSQDRIVNFFRRYSPASQRSRMVIFFLGLCREAGIPTLDSPRARQTGAGTPRASTRSAPTRATKPPRGGSAARGGSARAEREQAKPRNTAVPPLLEGLVMSLPEAGTPMSTQAREAWLNTARAALSFVYPETNGSGHDDLDGEDDEIDEQ